jgi:hypothetical protein
LLKIRVVKKALRGSIEKGLQILDS